MTINFLRILFILMLAYLFVEIRARPDLTHRDDVDDFRPMVLDPVRIEQMKKYKLEVLKTKILNAIHILEPPPIKSPTQVPVDIIRVLDNDFEDGEEFIRKPLNDDFTCVVNEEGTCSRFEFEISLTNRSASSIHVWFQKKVPAEPLFISFSYCSSVDEEDRTCDTSEILKETKTEFGWTMFKVPSKLASISQTENRFCAVEAFGSNFEKEDDRQPLLIINVSGKRKRRSTRSQVNQACTNQCCKIDFNINFKEIDWNFIVTPTEFNAYMCYGKCTNNHLNGNSTNYMNLVNLALKKKQTVSNAEQTWTPCCSPSELLPLEIIYELANDTINSDNHTIERRLVPNMVVKECRCW